MEIEYKIQERPRDLQIIIKQKSLKDDMFCLILEIMYFMGKDLFQGS